MSTVEPANKTSDEIEKLICQLQAGFIDFLEEVGSDDDARLLRLFDVWRQVSLRRTVDLAEGAETFFREGRLLPACTLTRCVVETVGVQYAVWKKLVALTGKSDLPGIHSVLMSAVFGRRDKGDDWPNKSMNVLTAIDHLEKQFPGFRSEYDRLSEYAHPGLAGGYGVYVRTEGKGLQSYFGQNPSGLEMDPWGRSELSCALLVAIEYNEQLQQVGNDIEALTKKED